MVKRGTTLEENAATDLLRALTAAQAEMIALTKSLVQQESPSHDREAVNELVSLIAPHFEQLGGRVRRHKNREFGDVLQIDFAGASRKKPLMLLGHLDTVYEAGTLRTMPVVEKRGKLYGPGVFDMKAGVVQMLFAIRALQQVRGALPRPLIVLLNPDEEVGSRASRAFTEKLAKRCEAVLVFEPPAGARGACKTARKGVGGYLLRVAGRAAHAGLDFAKGSSAIVELARQIGEIAKFTDIERGVTVNPGVIRGGTRTNVIAETAECEIDVRVTSARDTRELDRKFHRLKAFDKNCRLEIAGGVNRAPFERTKAVANLFAQAKALAAEIGFPLDEVSVGGGSDGNFTAGLGIPTLDGLGAVGDGAHAVHEHIVLGEMPKRAALAARLIETI